MVVLFDTDILLPLLGSAFSTKIQGAMFIGDGQQNEPLILSQNIKNSRVNPFAPQLERTLATRLKKGGYRFNNLRQQYRMRDELLSFPNERAYENLLITHPSVVSRPRNLALERALAIFYGETATGTTHLYYITVPGSACISSELNHSRSNIQNATVVTNLVFHLYASVSKEEFDVGTDLLILAGYQNQVHLIRELLRGRLHAYNKSADRSRLLTFEDLPDVGTIDGHQGHDRYFTIVDMVISDSQAAGFMKKSKRMNMAVTRAEEFLCIVASEDLREGFGDWEHFKTDPISGMKIANPKPYYAGYLDHCFQRGRICEKVPDGLTRAQEVSHWQRTHRANTPFPDGINLAEEPGWGDGGAANTEEGAAAPPMMTIGLALQSTPAQEFVFEFGESSGGPPVTDIQLPDWRAEADIDPAAWSRGGRKKPLKHTDDWQDEIDDKNAVAETKAGFSSPSDWPNTDQSLKQTAQTETPAEDHPTADSNKAAQPETLAEDVPIVDINDAAQTDSSTGDLPIGDNGDWLGGANHDTAGGW